MLDNSLPVIFGCLTTTLTQEEIQFFKQHKPYGFIIFARNIESPEQLKALVQSLRDVVGWHCPVLIDQEGGRVARLKPPHWPLFPAMADLVAKSSKKSEILAAIEKNAVMLGNTLMQLGINVNCAPVCDLRIDGAHDIIGDRSFGDNPEFVAECALAMCKGLKDTGVMPIIKHIPGHGRAKVDSHESLPIVSADLETLEASDFKAFKLLNDPDAWAMTAHIVYEALDNEHPATLSPAVIHYIREQIGFSGLIISDDLSMKALQGDLGDLARKSLQAGCDIVLHCNGDMQEMQSIVAKLY